MADKGSVDRATLIKVLRAHGVEASLVPGQKDVMLLVKGDIIEARIVPPQIGRKLVHYFSRKFGAPIHHFYNPLMAPPLPGETVQ